MATTAWPVNDPISSCFASKNSRHLGVRKVYRRNLSCQISPRIPLGVMSFWGDFLLEKKWCGVLLHYVGWMRFSRGFCWNSIVGLPDLLSFLSFLSFKTSRHHHHHHHHQQQQPPPPQQQPPQQQQPPPPQQQQQQPRQQQQQLFPFQPLANSVIPTFLEMRNFRLPTWCSKPLEMKWMKHTLKSWRPRPWKMSSSNLDGWIGNFHQAYCHVFFRQVFFLTKISREFMGGALKRLVFAMFIFC